jgi:DNA-binding IclR family transcriptional regulator
MTKSAERVIDILEAIAVAPRGLGISDLARRLAIPRSSTWNLARTLVHRRYLEQTQAGHLVLGSRLFDVGVCARADVRLRTAARPAMAALLERTGETVFVGILTPDFEVLQLDKVVSPHVIRYDAELGQRRPAHCTAIGKILLAELPPEQLGAYFRGRRLQRFTEKTITTRQELMQELERARETGVASSVDERVPGASAIAAAIHADSGRAIAGLIVAGPTGRIMPRRDSLAAEVRDAALRISKTLQEEVPLAARTPTHAANTGRSASRRQPGRRRSRG